MKGHPYLTAIGDWVMVALKDDGTPAGFGETATRVAICEVTGIVEEENGLMVHLIGDNDERLKVGYYNLHQISICDDTLQEFGFETCDGDKFASDWLYEDHRWRLDCREMNCPDLGYFYISWETDEHDLSRSYKICCRGYGEFMVLLEDTIAELQHWFFRFNSEWPMPLQYKGRSHFPMLKREEVSFKDTFNILKKMFDPLNP